MRRAEERALLRTEVSCVWARSKASCHCQLNSHQHAVLGHRSAELVFVIYAMPPGTMTDMTKMARVMPRLSRHEFSFPQPTLPSYFKSIPLELAHVGGAQNYSPVTVLDLSHGHEAHLQKSILAQLHQGRPREMLRKVSDHPKPCLESSVPESYYGSGLVCSA